MTPETLTYHLCYEPTFFWRPSLRAYQHKSSIQCDKILKDPNTITKAFAPAHSQNYDLGLFFFLRAKVPWSALGIPAARTDPAPKSVLWKAQPCPYAVQGDDGSGAAQLPALGLCSCKMRLAPRAALASLDFGWHSDVHPHHCLLLERCTEWGLCPKKHSCLA